MTNHFVVQRITRLYAVQNLTFLFFRRGRDHSDGFVIIRIQRLVFRFDDLHAILCQDSHKLIINQFYTFLHGVHVFGSFHRFDGTLKVIDHRQNAADTFFAGKLPDNPMKAEYYLPFAVDALIKDGKATAKVLTTDSRWYGVTYREDKPTICAAVAAMTENGDYPADL